MGIDPIKPLCILLKLLRPISSNMPSQAFSSEKDIFEGIYSINKQIIRLKTQNRCPTIPAQTHGITVRQRVAIIGPIIAVLEIHATGLYLILLIPIV